MTFMFVPYFSMISLITRNGYERGFLGNISEIFSTLGSIAVNSFFVVMLTKFSSSVENIYTQQAFTISMTVICVVMVVIVMLCVVFTKERVTDTDAEDDRGEEQKAQKVSTITALKTLFTNRYWLIMILAMFTVFFVVIMYSVGAAYYAQYVLQDMGMFSWMANSISIAQFGIMFVTPFFMKIFGKRLIYTIGMAMLSVGILGTSIPMMIIFSVLKGAGFDATLDAQGVAQPDSVITAIQFMYNWIPLILCAIVFVIMLLFFDLEKKMKELQNAQG